MIIQEKKELVQAIKGFCKLRILVIGDIIMDHFIWGSAARISPEAPVPIVNVKNEKFMLGGGANVLHNLHTLGASTSLCGVIGNDNNGAVLMEMLNELNSPIDGLMRCDRRPTTVKTRVIARNQQIVRFDREKVLEPSEETFQRIISYLEERIEVFDAIIISDYCKGVISARLMSRLRLLLKEIKRIPVIVDPKPFQPERFAGVTVITPNNQEAEQMSGVRIEDEGGLAEAAETLLSDLNCAAVMITRGEEGMAILEKGKSLVIIPTVAKEVYDVTGAGDTVIASLALGLAGGLSLTQAATLANSAAGIVVGKVGTATVSGQELQDAIQ